MPSSTAQSKYTLEEVWTVYQSLVHEGTLLELLDQRRQRFYRRVFTVALVVWGFIYQRLHADHSCDAYVSCVYGDKPHSESNSAYCQARKRLPGSLAPRLLRHTAACMRQQAVWVGDGLGRATYLLDGSTIQLSATVELMNYYGTSANQHGQSHWPLLRCVVAFDLHSGAVAAAAQGAFSSTEQQIAARLLTDLPPGGVVVADQYYGIFQFVQRLRDAQLDGVIRMQRSHLRRWIKDQPFRHGRDQLVYWSPSTNDQPQSGMSVAPIAGRLLSALCQRDGFRPLELYLFTTLTDAERDPFDALLALYGQRWQVELDLRHVKSTLQMQTLTGKSLEIVRKEFYFGLVAYNLLRMLLCAAAERAGHSPLHLSLASCLRRFRISQLFTCPPWLAAAKLPDADLLLERLLDRLANCLLPHRCQPRFEPRRVWSKPTAYKFFTQNRAASRLAELAARSIS